MSLGEAVLQLEDHPDQNLNPQIASSIHQLSPSSLPPLPIQTVCVEKNTFTWVSEGPTGLRMGCIPNTPWTLESCSLSLAGWLLWFPGLQALVPTGAASRALLQAGGGGTAGGGALHPSGSLQRRKKNPHQQRKILSEKTQMFLANNKKHPRGWCWWKEGELRGFRDVPWATEINQLRQNWASVVWVSPADHSRFSLLKQSCPAPRSKWTNSRLRKASQAPYHGNSQISGKCHSPQVGAMLHLIA